jgi:hypothetical protein
MNFDLQNLNPENMAALNTKATFNQTAYDQYLEFHTGPYSVGKASGLVFIALQHFDISFKKTVSKIRSQVASKFLPARYAKNSKLLAGFTAQREILATQFSGADTAVGEIVIQPWGFSSIANNKPLSRGTITLNTTHPEAYPIVQWNTFQNPVDADVMVRTGRVRNSHSTSPLRRLLARSTRRTRRSSRVVLRWGRFSLPLRTRVEGAV